MHDCKKTNTARVFKQIHTNVATGAHHIITQSDSAQQCYSLLTVHVHQDADVSASHSIEDLTGHGLGEEGVISCGDEHTLPGPLQQHATFRPPDRDAHTHRTIPQILQLHKSLLFHFDSGRSLKHDSLEVIQMLDFLYETMSVSLLSITAIKLTFKEP